MDKIESADITKIMDDSYNIFKEGNSCKEYVCNKPEYDTRTKCESGNRVYFNACEICKKVNADEVDLKRTSGRLLYVNLTLKNVCFGKEISIGVIILDNRKNIVAFKTITTILQKDKCCGGDKCGTLKRRVLFVLPQSDICNSLDLKVKVIANYTHPCKEDC